MYVSIYLSIYLLRISLSIYLLNIYHVSYLSNLPGVYLCMYPSIYLSTDQVSIYISLYLSIYISIYQVYLFIYLSINYLSIYLSIYLSTWYLSISRGAILWPLLYPLHVSPYPPPRRQAAMAVTRVTITEEEDTVEAFLTRVALFASGDQPRFPKTQRRCDKFFPLPCFLTINITGGHS